MALVASGALCHGQGEFFRSEIKRFGPEWIMVQSPSVSFMGEVAIALVPHIQARSREEVSLPDLRRGFLPFRLIRTPREAEELAAECRRWAGNNQVVVTPIGPDSRIDVQSDESVGPSQVCRCTDCSVCRTTGVRRGDRPATTCRVLLTRWLHPRGTGLGGSRWRRDPQFLSSRSTRSARATAATGLARDHRLTRRHRPLGQVQLVLAGVNPAAGRLQQSF